MNEQPPAQLLRDLRACANPAPAPPPLSTRDLKGILSIRHMELMRHALGLPNKDRAPYRNHFVTSEGSADYDDWQNLVGLGVATRQDGTPMMGRDLFTVTETGVAAVLLEGERRLPIKRRGRK